MGRPDDPTVLGGAVSRGSVSLVISSMAPAGGAATHAFTFDLLSSLNCTFGDTAVFPAIGIPRVGFERWICDGTDLGTNTVKGFEDARNVTASNDVLCFVAHDGVTGRELLRSERIATIHAFSASRPT